MSLAETGENEEKLSRNEVLQQILATVEHGREEQRAYNARIIDNAQPLIRRSDISSQEICNVETQIPEGEAHFTHSETLSELRNTLPPEDRRSWLLVYRLLLHDVKHIDFGAVRGHAENTPLFGEEDNPFPHEWQIFYQDILERLPEILAMSELPYGFAKALAEMELRKPVSELEQVQVADLSEKIAKGLQLRYFHEDFAITDPQTRQQDRNEIVLDLDPISIHTNLPMLWSVIQNISSNGCRELISSDRDATHLDNRNADPNYRPSAPSTLYIQSQQLPNNLSVINIADSGKGLSVDEVLASMKELIKSELLDEGDLKAGVLKILREWKVNPYAIRRLSVGDAFDMAAMARISGFSTRERLKALQDNEMRPNGIGLTGAVFLVEKMGGQILYTNMADGGALFTILLPNQYLGTDRTQKRDINREMKLIRKRILAGTYDGEFPSIAAAV